jgi:hypothetical protein
MISPHDFWLLVCASLVFSGGVLFGVGCAALRGDR